MIGDLTDAAAWCASPAALHCLSGHPFLFEGRVARVTERYGSDRGLQADGLFIRFDQSSSDQIGLLATTVKAFEQWIAQGRVHFLESAAAFNGRFGWVRLEVRRDAYLSTKSPRRTGPAKRTKAPSRPEIRDIDEWRIRK